MVLLKQHLPHVLIVTLKPNTVPGKRPGFVTFLRVCEYRCFVWHKEKKVAVLISTKPKPSVTQAEKDRLNCFKARTWKLSFTLCVNKIGEGHLRDIWGTRPSWIVQIPGRNPRNHNGASDEPRPGLAPPSVHGHCLADSRSPAAEAPGLVFPTGSEEAPGRPRPQAPDSSSGRPK